MSSTLTEPRKEALRWVATGRVVYSWPFNRQGPKWRVRDQIGTLRPQPYEWLRSEGYIELGPRERWSSPVVMTAAGSELWRSFYVSPGAVGGEVS